MNEPEILKHILGQHTGFEIPEPVAGKDTGYDARHFLLSNKFIEYRLSKITPKKVGQFVAIWRRNEQGITQPYEETDRLDFMVIRSKDGDKSGFFIFPKSVLVRKGIMSSHGRIGKRGVRVYPMWEKPMSKQAQSTQSWQVKSYYVPKLFHTAFQQAGLFPAFYSWLAPLQPTLRKVRFLKRITHIKRVQFCKMVFKASFSITLKIQNAKKPLM